MSLLADPEYLKRYNAIKHTKIRFKPQQCTRCKGYFKGEMMWRVNRWGMKIGGNQTIHTYYYCMSCMATPEDVLNEIDTDANPFGIAYVDDHTIAKTDSTRIRAALENAFPEVYRRTEGSEEKSADTFEGGVNHAETASTA